jgi:hypothetical protein
MIRELKEQHHLSYRFIIGTTFIAYDTFMRWKRRLDAGHSPVRRPGPKKLRRCDMHVLEGRIRKLDHNQKRTKGTTELRSQFKDSISRREYYRVVDRIRAEERRDQRLQKWQVSWALPNIAWAVDDTEDRNNGTKYFMHNIQDMCSSYKFQPVTTSSLLPGYRVAENLDELFTRYGPPLFLKRDGGSNLRSHEVSEVLFKHGVCSLPSPPYYPPYNGAIEKAQGEYKQELLQSDDLFFNATELVLRSKLAAHNLNHKPRRKLNGRNSCQVFFNEKNTTFGRKFRKEMVQWIHHQALDIAEYALDSNELGDDLRVAVQAWLIINRFISVTKNNKCYPFFRGSFVH